MPTTIRKDFIPAALTLAEVYALAVSKGLSDAEATKLAAGVARMNGK